MAGRSPRGVQNPGCSVPPQSTSCPVRPQIHPAPGQHPGCGVPHSPPSSALVPGHQPPFLPMPFVIPKQVTPPGCSLRRAPRAQLATAETQKASARHRFQPRIGQKTLSPPRDEGSSQWWVARGSSPSHKSASSLHQEPPHEDLGARDTATLGAGVRASWGAVAPVATRLGRTKAW